MSFFEYYTESGKQNDWVQNGCRHIGCLPSWSRGWLAAVAAALTSILREFSPKYS